MDGYGRRDVNGKALLDNQLKLVKNLKTSIIEMSQREMQLFNAFKEERMLLMQMLGVDGNERYNDYGDEHFNKQEAKRTVDEMYHVKDGKKYIGEKYDMQKAHEVCSKFKDKLEDEVEVADVYVAINAQYHDYCELFEKWFGKGNFDEMVFESAIAFWFDDVDFGEDKLWKYFNELK